jgi:hypothetical protein
MLERRFVSWLSYLFSHYKKHMSAAGEERSFGMDTDASVRCAIACAANSVFKDFNDKDDQTVGCMIAHAADLLRSNAKDISDKDDDSFVETFNPVGLKSDGGGEG